MNIAVLADIHSNYIALERCMEYALQRGITTFIFLGDYIGEMAYPERTMRLLREYKQKYECYFISGNKEKYWLDYRDRGETGWLEYSSTTGALVYAYRLLEKEDLDFFESLPISQNITFEGLPTLTACHGSPTNVRGELIRNEALTKEVLETSETDYILCGHTHIQGKYTLLCEQCLPGNNAYSTQNVSVEKGVSKQKVVLNPGAVGLPLKGTNNGHFMILHGENGKWTEEFIGISYDEKEVIAQLTESGMAAHAPYWCMITADLLRSKGNCDHGHAEVLNRAMELCRQETGQCNWPDIPEKYWEEAVKEFLPNP